MSESVQVPGNGLQVNAGPVTVAANGSVVVQVLLTIAICASVVYSVFTIHQQSTMITMQHNAIMVALSNVATSNENLFLSSMLPDGRKKDLPTYIQDKARDIVERRAASITNDRPNTQPPAPAFP